MLISQFQQKQQFEAELVKTQQEIQDQTLKHVGRELHDNVGQLLSLATMQMNALSKVASDDIQSKVSNASEAIKESLMVRLSYQQEQLIITAKDDGKGFDMDTAAKGSGLINMKKRAELINTTYNLESSTGEGTTLMLIYPYRLES